MKTKTFREFLLEMKYIDPEPKPLSPLFEELELTPLRRAIHASEMVRKHNDWEEVLSLFEKIRLDNLRKAEAISRL